MALKVGEKKRYMKNWDSGGQSSNWAPPLCMIFRILGFGCDLKRTSSVRDPKLNTP